MLFGAPRPELLRYSCFKIYWGLTAVRLPAGRYIRPLVFILARRTSFYRAAPLPRQARFDGANERLRYRSTANPSALSRLFGWLRHSSLLLGQLPVFYVGSPFYRTLWATRLPAACGYRRCGWGSGNA